MASTIAEVALVEKAALCCLKNAKQYIKDADILFSFKSYRHALALTILSDVEIGKAVIYHLVYRNVVSMDTLPPQYQSYFKERQYGFLARETWWVGLSIASNIEYLVQNLLDLSEETGSAATNKEEISECAQKVITEIIEKMSEENIKLKEFEDLLRKAFFVEFNLLEGKSSAQCDIVERALVRERLTKAKQRIKIGQPFFSLSLSEATKAIAEKLLRKAFQSTLPLRSEISQFTFPLKNHSEEVARDMENIE